MSRKVRFKCKAKLDDTIYDTKCLVWVSFIKFEELKNPFCTQAIFERFPL